VPLPLDYASVTREPRVSRLATALPPLTFLTCPALSAAAFAVVDGTAAFRPVRIGIALLPPLAIAALGLLAVRRIRRSNGEMIGIAHARFSILLSVFWIAVTAALLRVFA
jgi:hypothetical protein